ncbi:MAG: hypothetical protein IV100_02920, partial [Myxococcales bacterium]|nr:hypothetical protein [Myxococcales bacterium]
WAVRLTAFEHAGTPFVNALVRYDHGRVTERRPLDGLGLQLAPGKHTLVLERLEGALRVTVDGTSAEVPFDTASLVPNLALGCGELNTIIHRWKVDGIAPDGSPVAFHETFSVWDTWNRSSGAIGWLALMAWVILIGLPVSKAIFDAREAPLTLTPSLLLLPLPRVVFGLFGLVPFMPLLLQWVIAGLYVFFVWMSVLEALRGGVAYQLPAGERPLRKRLLIVSGAVFSIGLGAFGLAHVVREGPLGETWSAPTTSDGPPLAGAPDKAPLNLGERVQLAVPSGHAGSAIRFSADLSLDAGEAVRVDLMRSLPTLGDVFQVDRNQDRPSDADVDPDAPPDPEKESAMDAGVGDYELRAASVFVSADPGLTGHLRWLHNDKVERSPRSGWLLQPGRHELEVIAGGRYAVVLVGGRVVDFRADLDPDFQVGGVQILTMSSRTTALQNAAVRAATPHARAALALEAVMSATLAADVIGALAYACALLGLLGLLSAMALPRATTAPLRRTLWKLLRAGGLLVLFPILLVLVRFDVVRFELDLLLTLGLASLAFAAFNLRQLLVANGTRSVLRALSVVVVLFVGFEALALGFTEWRYGMTHVWNHGLSPAWYYVHDPMVLRLNPWFIDQRFKRRDFVANRAVAKNTKGVRVVVFGGSQTYGWGIPSMDRMA